MLGLERIERPARVEVAVRQARHLLLAAAVEGVVLGAVAIGPTAGALIQGSVGAEPTAAVIHQDRLALPGGDDEIRVRPGGGALHPPLCAASGGWPPGAVLRFGKGGG